VIQKVRYRFKTATKRAYSVGFPTNTKKKFIQCAMTQCKLIDNQAKSDREQRSGSFDDWSLAQSQAGNIPDHLDLPIKE